MANVGGWRMYGECYNEIPSHNEISWATMLQGFADPWAW